MEGGSATFGIDAFLRPEGAPQTVGSTGTDEARIGKLYTRAGAGRVATRWVESGGTSLVVGRGASQLIPLA